MGGAVGARSLPGFGEGGQGGAEGRVGAADSHPYCAAWREATI
jgi:hypothetical protein